MTLRILCLVTVGAAATAAPLSRSQIASIPAGPVSFEEESLRDVLVAAKRLAATRQIELWAERPAIAVSRVESVTLQAEGLTLDGLLEYATRTTGTEWRIRDGKIMIFTNRELREAHQARRKSPVRRRLDEAIIPEIFFEDLSLPECYRKVRAEAVKVAGPGSVPKIDVPQVPSEEKRITLKVTEASVLSLFELLAAVSVSTVDWRMEGSRIVIIDEAERRREKKRLARQRSRDSLDVDPFSAGPTPSRPRSVRRERRPRGSTPDFNAESYDHFGDNPFLSPRREPLSTFGADVDTASYANVRRLIREGAHIPVDAARIEEFVNYFDYDYAPPATGEVGKPAEGPPLAAHLEVAAAPWAPKHRLLRIGLKGYELDWNTRPPSNLVFLLDVSGSMRSPAKLPLVREALALLVRRLGRDDWVSIVVYAGASGLVLPPTPGDRTEEILGALDALEAGGSTNGGEGIQLAYETARKYFDKNGNNRVILCTDGDFNVGMTDRTDLTRLIEREAKSAIQLTVLGFGMGNYRDDLLETLSNRGDGNYAYIDSAREARKVFVHGLSGTLQTIAKDVKMQVEFNAKKVGAYRLLGYENRLLNAEDFDDDTKDAGDLGAGHTLTAFYELVPPGLEGEVLRRAVARAGDGEGEDDPGGGGDDQLLTLRIRYKEPDGAQSKLLTFPLADGAVPFAEASRDFRFAAAVASFGMILRDSDYRGASDVPLVLDMARGAVGDDPYGNRAEFVELVETYQQRAPGR